MALQYTVVLSMLKMYTSLTMHIAKKAFWLCIYIQAVAAILDTCRWSVTPHLLQVTEDATTSLLSSPDGYNDHHPLD